MATLVKVMMKAFIPLLLALERPKRVNNNICLNYFMVLPKVMYIGIAASDEWDDESLPLLLALERPKPVNIPSSTPGQVDWQGPCKHHYCWQHWHVNFANCIIVMSTSSHNHFNSRACWLTGLMQISSLLCLLCHCYAKIIVIPTILSLLSLSSLSSSSSPPPSHLPCWPPWCPSTFCSWCFPARNCSHKSFRQSHTPESEDKDDFEVYISIHQNHTHPVNPNKRGRIFCPPPS